MSTYAELNCFNDLLVKAMKRAEARHRAELNALRSKYESLVAVTEVHDTPQCSVCEHWFEGDHEGVYTTIGDDQSSFTCEACMAKPNCPVAHCIRCDDGVDSRTGQARFHSWQPGAESDCYCEGCFKFELLEQQVGGHCFQVRQYYNRHRALMQELKNCKNWVL